MIQITKNVATRSKLHHLMVGILESSCFFNDAPTKWLIPGSGRGAVPEIPPFSRPAWVFRWLKIERSNYPKLMLEDGCRNSSLYPLFVAWRRGEKNPSLFAFTGSFHGTCRVFASHMPSCESMMRHVEEAFWNHFKWTSCWPVKQDADEFDAIFHHQKSCGSFDMKYLYNLFFWFDHQTVCGSCIVTPWI